MIRTQQPFVSRWIAVGAIVSAMAVALGAFGAHGLESAIAGRVEDVAKNVVNWETGSRYLMYHGLGIVLIGIVSSIKGGGRLLSTAALLFLIGVILFSGLLFVLSLTDMKFLGAIVPLGGLALIVGWICFAVGAIKKNRLSSTGAVTEVRGPGGADG